MVQHSLELSQTGFVTSVPLARYALLSGMTLFYWMALGITDETSGTYMHQDDSQY